MDGESRVDAGNLIIVERLLTVLADIVRVVWYGRLLLLLLPTNSCLQVNYSLSVI